MATFSRAKPTKTEEADWLYPEFAYDEIVLDVSWVVKGKRYWKRVTIMPEASNEALRYFFSKIATHLINDLKNRG